MHDTVGGALAALPAAMRIVFMLNTREIGELVIVSFENDDIVGRVQNGLYESARVKKFSKAKPNKGEIWRCRVEGFGRSTGLSNLLTVEPVELMDLATAKTREKAIEHSLFLMNLDLICAYEFQDKPPLRLIPQYMRCPELDGEALCGQRSKGTPAASLPARRLNEPYIFPFAQLFGEFVNQHCVQPRRKIVYTGIDNRSSIDRYRALKDFLMGRSESSQS